MSYNQKPPGPGGSGLPPNSSKNAQVAQAFLGIQQQMQSLVHGQNAQQGDLNAFLTQQQRIQNIFKQQQFLQQHYQQQMQQQQTQHHAKERGSNTGNEPLALTRTPGAAELLNKTFQQHHQQQQANGSSVAAAAAAVANPTLNQIQQQLQAMSPNIMQQIQAFQYQMQQQQQQHHSQAAQSQIQQTSATNSTPMHQQHSQQHHHQNQHGHQHQHSHQQQQLHHQHPQQQQQKAYSSAVQQFQQSFQKHYYAQTAAAVTKANVAGSLPPPLTNQKKTPAATSSSQIPTVHQNVSNMASVGANSSINVIPSNPSSSVNRQSLLSVPIMPPSKTISPASSPTISKSNQTGKLNVSETSSGKTGSASMPISNTTSTLQKVHDNKSAEDSNITVVSTTVVASNLKIDKIPISTKPVEQKEAMSLTKQLPMEVKLDKPNNVSIERISTDEDKKTDAISKTKNEITSDNENCSIIVSDKVEAKPQLPVQCTEESSKINVNPVEDSISKMEVEADNKNVSSTDIKEKVTETAADLTSENESVKTENLLKNEFNDKESLVENKFVSNNSKGEEKDDAEVSDNETDKVEKDDIKEEKSEDIATTKGENDAKVIEKEETLKEDPQIHESKDNDVMIQLNVTSTTESKEDGKVLKESENIQNTSSQTADEQNTIEITKNDSNGEDVVSKAANISIEISAKNVDSAESIKESSLAQSSKKVSRQSKHGKSSALTHTSKISEKGITITIRAPKEKKKLKSPEPNSDCKSDIDSKGDEIKSKFHTEENTKVQSQKLENESSTDEGTARKSKRHRYKTFLYQSPLPELAYITKLSASEASNSPKPVSNEDKLTLFYKNEYMAVRNEEGTFYLCQTMQNVYRTSPRISIRWLSEDSKKLGVFNPDFYDHIDIESVLTTVDLQKIDKDHWRLPEAEKKRIENILKKAIDVEKGVVPRPELSEQNPDGLDISLYKSESQIERKSLSGYTSHTPKKTKSKISQQTSEPNNTGKRKSSFKSRSTGSSAKRLAKSLSMKKRKNASKKSRKSTISSSDDDIIETSDDEEDIEYKPSQKKSVSCTATKSSPRSQRSPLAKARAASPITPTSSRMSKVIPLKVNEISTINLSSPSMRNERAKKRNSMTEIDHDLHPKKPLPTTSGNIPLNVTPTKNLKTTMNKAKGNETSNESSEAKSSTSPIVSNPFPANNNSRPTRNRK